MSPLHLGLIKVSVYLEPIRPLTLALLERRSHLGSWAQVRQVARVDAFHVLFVLLHAIIVDAKSFVDCIRAVEEHLFWHGLF